MTEETGAKIDISDDGTILIATADGEVAKEVIARIKAITAKDKIGRRR